MDSGIFFQENVLSIDLVRDKIFSYLPRSDLLKCSLISKKWLPHTRQFLHSHHACMLKLVLVQREKLAVVLEMLENSSEVLFNGVYLNLDLFLRHVSYGGHLKACYGSLEEIKIKTKPILQDIIRQIPMKFVVSGRSFESAYKSLQILHFCLDLLPIEQIEDLKIHGRVDEYWNFAFDMSGLARTFLKLKKLDIDMTVTNSASLAKFLINFPVLREWSAEVTHQALACFVEAKKEYLVKSLVFGLDNTIEPNLIPCMQSAHVFLRKITICLHPKPEYVQLFWHLLRTSNSSLQEVGMCLQFFLPFVRSGNYPLNNVTELVIYLRYNDKNSDENTRETVRQDVDTRRIFPNAVNVKVSRVSDWTLVSDDLRGDYSD